MGYMYVSVCIDKHMEIFIVMTETSVILLFIYYFITTEFWQMYAPEILQCAFLFSWV